MRLPDPIPLKIRSPISKKMKSRILLAAWLVLAVVSSPLVHAAGDLRTGVIEGRVVNPVTGGYLENAHLSVEGTTLDAFTDSPGSYRLVNVPAGAARVKAFYTGLPVQVREVAVVAGGTVQHDVALVPVSPPSGTGLQGVVKLSEFHVNASRDMDSAAIAINTQRFAANIRNVVSTEEFGNVAEGSVGEFLKFLPGITMEYEGGTLARGIQVNGAPSDHTPITVDGFSLASAGGSNTMNDRKVLVDMVSITNVSRIEVMFSPTPETQGSALAGSVNMVPRSAFERSRPLLNANVYLAMRDSAREFRRTPGPYEERTSKIHPGFDFSYVKPVNQRFGFTLSGGRYRDSTHEEFIQNTWRGVGSATNGVAFPHTTPDQPYLTSTAVRLGTKRATRLSFGGSMDYRLSRNDRLSFSFAYSNINLINMNRTLTFNITRVAPGSFTPFSTNGAPGQGDIQLQNLFRDRRNYTFTPTLLWRHDGPIWKTEAGLGLSQGRNVNSAIDKGYFSQVTARRTGLTVSFADICYLRPRVITVADGTTGAPVDPYNINTYAMTQGTSIPIDANATNRTAFANVRRDFYGQLPLTLKGGLDFRQMIKDQLQSNVAWAYVGRDGRTSTTPVGSDDQAAPFFAPIYSELTLPYGFPRVQWLDNMKAWEHYQANTGQFTFDKNAAYRSLVSFSKYAEELISSAYLRGDLHFLNRRLKLVGGVRAEQTNTRGEGPLTDITRNYRRDSAGRIMTGANGQPLTIATSALEISQLTYLDRGAKAEKEYLRLFPSLNASFNVTENLIARAAYYQSIGRPVLGQYAGGMTLPDTERPPGPTNQISVSNAEIKAWRAESYTARLEYYFEGVGLVSVGGFVRNFENFFGSTLFTPTPQFLAFYGVDFATYGAYDVSTQRNLEDTVRMTGVDVSYKQALTFLPHWARGVQVFANGSAQRATGGDATADLAGYVPQVASWGVSLAREKFNVRLNWSYKGRFRQGQVNAGSSIEPGTFNYSSKRGFLDVLGDYYFRKGIAVYFNLRNVGDTPEDLKIYGPSTPQHARFRSREEAGSLWTFGLKGTF